MLLSSVMAHTFIYFLKITITIITLLLLALTKILFPFIIAFLFLNEKVLKAYYIGITSFNKLYSITDPLFQYDALY